jgi:hypothetical protein
LLLSPKPWREKSNFPQITKWQAWCTHKPKMMVLQHLCVLSMGQRSRLPVHPSKIFKEEPGVKRNIKMHWMWW